MSEKRSERTWVQSTGRYQKQTNGGRVSMSFCCCSRPKGWKHRVAPCLGPAPPCPEDYCHMFHVLQSSFCTVKVSLGTLTYDYLGTVSILFPKKQSRAGKTRSALEAKTLSSRLSGAAELWQLVPMVGGRGRRESTSISAAHWLFSIRNTHIHTLHFYFVVMYEYV